jgi:hypothetical protein
MMDPDDAARYPLAPGYRDSDPVPDPTWADPASEVVLRVSKLLYAVLKALGRAARGLHRKPRPQVFRAPCRCALARPRCASSPNVGAGHGAPDAPDANTTPDTCGA